MFSAVAAAKPFGVPTAHLYGGETTLGAIDDAFRHCLSHLSTWHFTGAEIYARRVRELVADDDRVFNVGYLSLDTLHRLDFISPRDLAPRCGLDLSRPTLLCTFHPETVSPERNAGHARSCARPSRASGLSGPRDHAERRHASLSHPRRDSRTRV